MCWSAYLQATRSAWFSRTVRVLGSVSSSACARTAWTNSAASMTASRTRLCSIDQAKDLAMGSRREPSEAVRHDSEVSSGRTTA